MKKRKILATAGIVLLFGFFGQSLLMIGHLASLDAALGQNLKGTRQLVAVQQQMIVKNQALNHLLSLTRQVGQSIGSVNRQSATISQYVMRLESINAQNDRENAAIQQSSGVASQNVLAINQGVLSLDRGTERLLSLLSTIQKSSAYELTEMHQLLVNTKTIEARTP